MSPHGSGLANQRVTELSVTRIVVTLVPKVAADLQRVAERSRLSRPDTVNRALSL